MNKHFTVKKYHCLPWQGCVEMQTGAFKKLDHHLRLLKPRHDTNIRFKSSDTIDRAICTNCGNEFKKHSVPIFCI